MVQKIERGASDGMEPVYARQAPIPKIVRHRDTGLIALEMPRPCGCCCELMLLTTEQWQKVSDDLVAELKAES